MARLGRLLFGLSLLLEVGPNRFVQVEGKELAALLGKRLDCLIFPNADLDCP